MSLTLAASRRFDKSNACPEALGATSTGTQSSATLHRQDTVERKQRIVAEVAAALETEAGMQQMRGLAEAGTLAEKEERLVALCRQINQAVTEASLTAERGYQGARTTCAACGGRARYVRDEPKGYLRLTGEVRLLRSVYECFGCRHRQYRPPRARAASVCSFPERIRSPTM